MSEVFDLIFDMFAQVITWLKQIPVIDGVSLFDFSLAILILTITIVAFVPIVSIGSTNYVNDTLRVEEENRRKAEVEKQKASSELDSKQWGLLNRRTKESVVTFLEEDYKNKYGGRE